MNNVNDHEPTITDIEFCDPSLFASPGKKISSEYLPRPSGQLKSQSGFKKLFSSSKNDVEKINIWTINNKFPSDDFPEVNDDVIDCVVTACGLKKHKKKLVKKTLNDLIETPFIDRFKASALKNKKLNKLNSSLSTASFHWESEPESTQKLFLSNPAKVLKKLTENWAKITIDGSPIDSNQDLFPQICSKLSSPCDIDFNEYVTSNHKDENWLNMFGDLNHECPALKVLPAMTKFFYQPARSILSDYLLPKLINKKSAGTFYVVLDEESGLEIAVDTQENTVTQRRDFFVAQDSKKDPVPSIYARFSTLWTLVFPLDANSIDIDLTATLTITDFVVSKYCPRNQQTIIYESLENASEKSGTTYNF